MSKNYCEKKECLYFIDHEHDLEDEIYTTPPSRCTACKHFTPFDGYLVSEFYKKEGKDGS